MDVSLCFLIIPVTRKLQVFNCFVLKFTVESCTTPQSRSGFCVPYKKCPIVLQLIQAYGSASMIPIFHRNFILRSKCSKSNEPVSSLIFNRNIFNRFFFNEFVREY